MIMFAWLSTQATSSDETDSCITIGLNQQQFKPFGSSFRFIFRHIVSFAF
jgi:hypothetical protein